MVSKNKTSIIIFFLIFIFGNIAIITFNALSAGPNESSEYLISIYDPGSNEPKSIQVQEFAFSESNFLYRGETFNIYSLGGSKYKVNESEVELIEGTLFIQGDNLSIRYRDQIVELQNRFSILVNQNDGVVITSGQPSIASEFLKVNTQIPFSNNSNLTDFNRSKLRGEQYTQFINFLTQLGVIDNYFSDFDGPELISVSPRNNFTTIDGSIRFYGYTETDATVTLNGSELIVDEKGYFTKQIDLKIGDNAFEIILRDKFGNETSEEIHYIRRDSRSVVDVTPTSFPI